MKYTNRTIDELLKYGWEVVERKSFAEAKLYHPEVGRIHYSYGAMTPYKEKDNGNTDANSTTTNRGTVQGSHRYPKDGSDIPAAESGINPGTDGAGNRAPAELPAGRGKRPAKGGNGRKTNTKKGNTAKADTEDSN